MKNSRQVVVFLDLLGFSEIMKNNSKDSYEKTK